MASKINWVKLIDSRAREIVRWGGVVSGLVIALKYNTHANGCEFSLGGIPTNTEQVIGAGLAFIAGVGGAAIMKIIELKFKK